MVTLGAGEPSGAVLDPEFAAGTALGKRYVHGSGAEIPVTRGGAGMLTVDAVPLAIKDAKPLPASDRPLSAWPGHAGRSLSKSQPVQ